MREERDIYIVERRVLAIQHERVTQLSVEDNQPWSARANKVGLGPMMGDTVYSDGDRWKL